MGNLFSSPEDIAEKEEKEITKQKKLLEQLSLELESLKMEVKEVNPVITEGVNDTIISAQDATIIRYSELTDKDKITSNIKSLFKGFPAVQFFIDSAESLIGVMNSTEEMTEIARWQERKTVKRVGDQVFGMECHFKVKIFERDVGRFRSSKETVCFIGYKFLAHSLRRDASQYPDEETTRMLTF